MTTQTTSRRQLLRVGTSVAAYAAGAAIVTGGIAIAGEARSATTSTPELSRLIAEHKRADAAVDRFYLAVHNPIVERHRAAFDAHTAAIEAIPHVEEPGGLTIGGAPFVFSSRKSYSRANAEHYIECDRLNPNRGGDWGDTIAAARRFIQADDERRAAIRAIGDAPVCDPSLDAREEEAYAPVRAARQAIYAFPCATLADLAAKLAWIEQDDGMDGEDLLPLAIVDVARLQAQEAQA